MPLLRLNRHPSDRQLLVFGAAWLVFLGASGCSAYQHQHPAAAAVLGAAAVAVPLAGLMVRPVLRWAYLGLSYATFPIGYVLSCLVLAAVYFVALTPIGWIMRLAGHDALGRRPDPARSSYWTPRPPSRPTASYFKQD